MGLLDGCRCYLAGPIDFVEDDGVKWRQNITKQFEDQNINIKVLDPTDKPIGLGSEIGVEKHYIQHLKNEGKYNEVTKWVKKLQRIDLRMVDMSDFVIALVDPRITMFGTIHEIIEATRESKPVFVLTIGGKPKASGWLFGLVDYHEMFDDVDKCIDHIDLLNKGVIPLDDRWVMLNQKLRS